MRDLQREIVNQVASGTISPEEGAARLEGLEAGPSPVTSPTPSAGPKQVKVVSRLGNTEVIGDPSVSFAVADGPHRIRQDGDTMLIEQSGFGDYSFEFIRRAGRANAFGETLTIRMNPTVPLVARVQAGNVRIDGIHSALTAEVQAGNCRVNDLRGPFRLGGGAGYGKALGPRISCVRLIRCNTGEDNGSCVPRTGVSITAGTTMGDVAIEGEGVTHSGSY